MQVQPGGSGTRRHRRGTLVRSPRSPPEYIDVIDCLPLLVSTGDKQEVIFKPQGL